MKGDFGNNPIRSIGGRFCVFIFGILHKGFWRAVRRLSWNRNRIEAYELQRLQAIVSYAYEHSPMYKKMYDDANISPSDLQILSDIKKFPVLTKAMLKQGLLDKTIFTSNEVPEGTIAEPTTGSTGNPVTLYLDKHAHHERSLNGTRALWLMGALPYKRFAFLWRKKGISFGQRLRTKLGLFKHIPVVDVQNASGSAVDKKELSKIVNELIAFKPHIIRGYTSALWIIAQYVKKHGLVLHPERVIISAEYMPALWKEEMQNIFQCPVHNLYGGTEAAPVALSLGYDSELAVFGDFYYTELVDDNGDIVPVDVPGRIVVTDYANKYMPLIRYEIGDVAQWDPKRIGPFATFSEVKGRINDVFVLPGGKVVFSHNWHIYLRDLKSVSKFKVVQKTLNNIDITLEKSEPSVQWNEELETLKKTVQDAFGPEIIFNWNLVDTIPLDPGDKFRSVRSELDQNIILKSVSNTYIERLKEYPLSSHKAWEIGDKKEVLKLDWNEADMEIPDVIKKSLHDFIDHGQLSWYPDVSNKELVAEIANYSDVPKESVQYFEGSDCGLDYIVRTFMQGGDEAVLAAPTYDNFRVYVESVGGVPKFAYGRDLFASDVASLEDAITAKTKIIYIVNPNNPTGVSYSHDEVEYLLKKYPEIIVIIDEAYAEFSGETVIPFIEKYDNLIVSRSFAKAFGLASMRIGYVLAAPEIINHINKIRNGKNVPALAQIAAIAALRNREYMDAYVADVTNARAYIIRELQNLGFESKETKGNFILVKTNDPAVFQKVFQEKKVFVRGLNHLSGMDHFVRISIPGMRGAEKFISIAKLLKQEGKI